MRSECNGDGRSGHDKGILFIPGNHVIPRRGITAQRPPMRSECTGDGRSGHDKGILFIPRQPCHPPHSTQWTCVRNGQSPNGPTEGSPHSARQCIYPAPVMALPAMTRVFCSSPGNHVIPRTPHSGHVSVTGKARTVPPRDHRTAPANTFTLHR
jgi:hypothetical protein